MHQSPHLPVNAAAQGPVTIQEEVDGHKQQHHGNGVIEQTQHKDGVDAVGGTAHEEEHVGRDLHRCYHGVITE